MINTSCSYLTIEPGGNMLCEAPHGCYCDEEEEEDGDDWEEEEEEE